MNQKQLDEQFMQRALTLAELAGIDAAPNPKVGAVIVHQGKIVGEGYHKLCGEAHAEVNAVNSVVDKSKLIESTIYVTLEPCAHYGKTPPCAELLVKHNFKRVVIATLDPFSLVSGKGLKMLKDAGIDTEINILETQAQWQNRRFFNFHLKKRPYIILKWAESQDGFMDKERVANEKGVNWITQPETQVLTHKWRTEEQAILTSWKTISTDNPSLTPRAFEGKAPLRIILDRNGKSPLNATVYSDGGKTLVFTKNSNFSIPNIEVVYLEDFTLQNVMNEMYQLQLLSVIIEAGPSLLQEFINENIWDEARVYTGQVHFTNGKKAPKLNLTSNSNSLIGKDQLSIYLNN